MAITAEDVDERSRTTAPDPLPAIGSLMVARAKSRGMMLVTGNTRDLKRTGVALLNPFESR